MNYTVVTKEWLAARNILPLPTMRKSKDGGIYSIPGHNTQNRYFGYSFNKAFENENIVIQQLLSE